MAQEGVNVTEDSINVVEDFAARYEKAIKLAESRKDTVFRDRLTIWWRKDNQQLCYKVQLNEKTCAYIMVDTQTGSTRPAFNHAELASELVKAGIKNASEDHLNLRFHSWEASNKIKFSTVGAMFEVDLDSMELTDLCESANDQNRVKEIPSKGKRGGKAAKISFRNDTLEDVEVFWLDSEGSRISYGKLAAQVWRHQSSYEWHVWVITGMKGEDICAFQVLDMDTDAIIKPKKTVKTDSSIVAAGRQGEEQERQKNENDKKGESRETPNGTNSPDFKWTIIIREHNVVLQDKACAEEFQLTEDGLEGNAYGNVVEWSPDSKTVAVVRVEDGEDRKITLVESCPEDQIQPKVHSIRYPKPGDRLPNYSLYLIDTETHNVTMIEQSLFPDPSHPIHKLNQLSWTSDSSELTFLYCHRGNQLLRLISVERESKTVRTVVEERSPTFLYLDEDSVYEVVENSNEIIWSSERDGWNHLYLYDTKTSKVKNQITSGNWRVHRIEHIDVEKRQIWFHARGIREAQDPYYVHLCYVNFDGSLLLILTEGNGTHSIQWSPNKQYIVDTWSRVDQAPIHELRGANDGKLICLLEEADTTLLQKTGYRPPVRFSTPGRDGKTPIHGIIQYPTNYTPGTLYPVLEYIYAGPHTHHVPKSFRANHDFQILSELGFIVVLIDGMGTSARSKAFHNICHLNLSDSGFPDRILFLTAAAAQYPELDLSRVGIIGYSAGGQSSLRALIDYPSTYKCAVSVNGCHDNRIDKLWWNEQWLGWPVDQAIYDTSSNVVHARRLPDSSRLMLVVGEMDTNVDPACTMQVVDALIKADRDFELFVVPGGGHGCGDNPWVKRKVAMFLMRWLGAAG